MTLGNISGSFTEHYKFPVLLNIVVYCSTLLIVLRSNRGTLTSSSTAWGKLCYCICKQGRCRSSNNLEKKWQSSIDKAKRHINKFVEILHTGYTMEYVFARTKYLWCQSAAKLSSFYSSRKLIFFSCCLLRNSWFIDGKIQYSEIYPISWSWLVFFLFL